jgi:hypothetical protein
MPIDSWFYKVCSYSTYRNSLNTNLARSHGQGFVTKQLHVSAHWEAFGELNCVARVRWQAFKNLSLFARVGWQAFGTVFLLPLVR